MIDYFEWADEYEKESKKIKCCIEKYKEELKGKVTNSRRIELEQLVIKLNNIRKEHELTAKQLRSRSREINVNRKDGTKVNYYKAAEDILRSVNTLKKAVENLKSRKNRLVLENKPSEPGSIDYSKPFTDTSFVNNTLNELLEVSECTRNISETERKIQEIENILEQLADEHKTILVMWYIERKSKESIMSKMYIESLTTVYNLKNKAVAEFALLYFGASAINSI